MSPSKIEIQIRQLKENKIRGPIYHSPDGADNEKGKIAFPAN